MGMQTSTGKILYQVMVVGRTGYIFPVPFLLPRWEPRFTRGWLGVAVPVPHPLSQSRVGDAEPGSGACSPHSLNQDQTRSRARKSFPSLSRIILFLTQSLPFRLEGPHERGCVLTWTKRSDLSYMQPEEETLTRQELLKLYTTLRLVIFGVDFEHLL